MGPDGVVVASPLFDEDFDLVDGVENFAVEQFVAQAAVEAFDASVLPRASRRDERGLRTDGGDPVTNGLRHELWAVVRADGARRAAEDEQVRQTVDDIRSLELAVDPDRQTFARKLVDDTERLDDPAVGRPIMDEVLAPDMVQTFGP